MTEPRSSLLEVLFEVVDEEVDGLVDVPFHIGLTEDAPHGPAVPHVLERHNLQLVSQNLEKGPSVFTLIPS